MRDTSEYNWDNCKTLCDVGSGVGSFSMPLSRLYPHIHISMIDLPGPIGQAKQFWTREYPEAIVEGRVKLVEGDFFKPITVKDQDIYYVRDLPHRICLVSLIVLHSRSVGSQSQRVRVV